jgi:HPt (histidine-containing phosphotransfer) domain-containing protein
MALWRKRRPEVVADLEQLVAFLTEWDHKAADAVMQAQAAALAHQLHGIFGIFGWQELKTQVGSVEQSLISAEPNFSELITAVLRVASNLP